MLSLGIVRVISRKLVWTPMKPCPRLGPFVTDTSTQQRLQALDDVALVELCRDGDDRAWRTIVRRYRSLVYSVALRAGLDDETAADVFQQTWIEFHRSLERIRDAQALPRWLAVTTRRVAYKAAIRADVPIEGSMDEMVDPAALPGEELASIQRLHELEVAIEALGGTCEKLLRRMFLDADEPNYEQISESVGIAVGSIGPLRSRCLGRLRRRLEESK